MRSIKKLLMYFQMYESEGWERKRGGGGRAEGKKKGGGGRSVKVVE